ncbi:MAG: CidA/LrgA family protein [[Clostridium] scindens]
MASGVEPDAFFCYNNRDSLYTNERRKSYECKNIKASLGIILAICLAAEFIVSLLPIAFPSSVMAILILALLLFTKILKEEHIRETGDFLLSNMALVFVPISIGMVEDFGLLKGQPGGILDRGVHLAGDDISGNLCQRAYRADVHEEAGGEGRTGR